MAILGLTPEQHRRVGAAVRIAESLRPGPQKFAANQKGAPAAGWTPYYFGVSIKDADEVTVAAGKVINGTTVSTIAAADVTIGTTNGTFYLSIEIWYNAAWKSAYLKDTTYPTQADKTDGGSDYPCFRVLIAVVTVAANVVSSIAPVWPGQEIINPNIAD